MLFSFLDVEGCDNLLETVVLHVVFFTQDSTKVKGGLFQFYCSVGKNRYSSLALGKWTPLPATPPRRGA